MNMQQFREELMGVQRDADMERQTQDEFPLSLSQEDVRLAIFALREHAHGFGDLFEHTEPPTDEALLMVFAFLVLP